MFHNKELNALPDGYEDLADDEEGGSAMEEKEEVDENIEEPDGEDDAKEKEDIEDLNEEGADEDDQEEEEGQLAAQDCQGGAGLRQG